MKTKNYFNETNYMLSHQISGRREPSKSRGHLYVTLSVTLLFLSFGLSCLAQSPEIKKALYYSETERPSKAFSLMEELIKTNLSNASQYYYLGRIQMKEGETAKAHESFKKGIELDDKEPINYSGIAHLLMKQKKLADAKPFLDKAILLTKTKNTEAVKALADAYLTDEHYVNEAITLLKKNKSIGALDPGIDILLGDAYALQRNAGVAISNYENAAAQDTKSATPLFKIATIYLLSKTEDIALDYFKKVTALDADYAPGFRELGELQYALKHGDESVKAYERYLALTEKPGQSTMRYAFSLFMVKDFTKAIEIFKNVVGKGEGSTVAMRYYGYSLFEAGDTQSAKTIFESYFAKAAAKDIDALDYNYFGKTLLKLNEDSLAVTYLERSINLEKGQTSILQLLAETNFKLKRYQNSISSYSELMKLRKKPMAQDYYTIGRAYYFSKDYAKADSAFVKLTELQPNLGAGFLWLARSKSNLDPETEQGLAKPFYDKYIELNGANTEKNKNDLIEAYSYLGYYYFLKNETLLSKGAWEKVIALNPKDEKAVEALKAIH